MNKLNFHPLYKILGISCWNKRYLTFALTSEPSTYHALCLPSTHFHRTPLNLNLQSILFPIYRIFSKKIWYRVLAKVCILYSSKHCLNYGFAYLQLIQFRWNVKHKTHYFLVVNIKKIRYILHCMHYPETTNKNSFG